VTSKGIEMFGSELGNRDTLPVDVAAFLATEPMKVELISYEAVEAYWAPRCLGSKLD
jgi:hypothetical protein